jgi:heme-degrading monooxygenase HmoA
MHVILWQFQVRPGQELHFEKAYGPAGIWAQFFHQAAGYRGTQLLRDHEVPGRYVTIDQWTSQAAFDAFRTKHAREYDAIDRECENLTAQESPVGSFTDLGESPSANQADSL